MQSERSGFHRSYLSLLVAGILLCGPVQARAADPADFLSAVGDVPVPPPVSAPALQKQAPPAASSGARPQSGAPPRSVPHPARRAGEAHSADAALLKRRLAQAQKENATLQRQTAAPTAGQRDRDTTLAALRAQTERLSGELATARQALSRAEDAKENAGRETERVREELRHLTLLNHALSVKADVAAIAGTPVASGAKAAASDELARIKAQLAEQQAASGALSEETARLRETLAKREAAYAALTQRTAGLQAQLAGLTRARDQLQKQIADTRAQTAGMQTATSQQEARLSAMRAERDRLVQDAEKNGAALASVREQMATVSHERDALRAQLAAGGGQGHVQTQLAALTRDRDSLKASVTALTAERDALQGKAAALTAQVKGAEDGLNREKTGAEDVRKQLTAMTAERDALQEKAAALTAQVKSAEDGLNREKTGAEDVRKQLTAMTAERDALQEKAAALTAQVKGAEDGLNREKTGAEDVRKQLTAMTAERDRLQKQTMMPTAQPAALQAGRGDAVAAESKNVPDEQDKQQIRALNDQVAALTKQLAEKNDSEPALSTEDREQLYAGGVMLSRTLLRSLNLQKNLGLEPDPSLLIAGVSDGIRGQVRLADDVLDKRYQALISRLSSREEGKYREGEAVLEKETAGRKILKRNRSVFFVQAAAGKAKLKPGDPVVFDLKESVLKGRVLRDNKGVKAAFDDKLPYLIHEALTLAGRGGVTDVYCMASDVYPPEQLPEGLFGYSLLKFTLSVSKG
ncbi:MULTISPECIES: hypothetical protein [Enterobacter]|uniref:hypothetical protein n=1 Tax=Enterobacter TaxID=547 RepID=UPI0007ADA8E9|nr:MULTISPECIES: hypothetical protein [Enterobacter]AMZ77771.1 hypothetical protein A4308_12495 [Enterobacter sp. ODB01]VAL43384.1 peptidylprolyl isomerase, FKBP-type [Enterobacter kobei]